MIVHHAATLVTAHPVLRVSAAFGQETIEVQGKTGDRARIGDHVVIGDHARIVLRAEKVAVALVANRQVAAGQEVLRVAAGRQAEVALVVPVAVDPLAALIGAAATIPAGRASRNSDDARHAHRGWQQAWPGAECAEAG